MNQELENHRENIDKHNKQFYTMKKNKDTLQNERKYVACCAFLGGGLQVRCASNLLPSLPNIPFLASVRFFHWMH